MSIRRGCCRPSRGDNLRRYITSNLAVLCISVSTPEKSLAFIRNAHIAETERMAEDRIFYNEIYDLEEAAGSRFLRYSSWFVADTENGPVATGLVGKKT